MHDAAIGTAVQATVDTGAEVPAGTAALAAAGTGAESAAGTVAVDPSRSRITPVVVVVVAATRDSGGRGCSVRTISTRILTIGGDSDGSGGDDGDGGGVGNIYFTVRVRPRLLSTSCRIRRARSIT